MGAASAFTTGNYPRQPVAASAFLNSLNVCFLIMLKSDVMKDVRYATSFNLF